MFFVISISYIGIWITSDVNTMLSKLKLHLNFNKLVCWLDIHGKDQSDNKPKCAENLEDNANNKESEVEPSDDGCSSSHRGEYLCSSFPLAYTCD